MLLLRMLWGLLFFSSVSWGSSFDPSPINVNPLSWMHGLPRGSTPGWSQNNWFSIEENLAQIWSVPASFRNKDTGKTLFYQADFEQLSTIIHGGYALTDRFAVGFELPYACRGGGVFDETIDKFHLAIGSNRFQRNENPSYRSAFRVETDGVSKLSSNSFSGFSYFKTELKFWLLKWTNKPTVCPCGLGVSFQFKTPLGNPENGMTSGWEDYSGLIHGGFPLGENSGLWATLGFTYTEKNKVFEDWPRKQWQTMFDIMADIGLSDQWGILIQTRLESPFMDEGKLEYLDDEPLQARKDYNQISSGWPSLVYWRVYESLGVRYRWDEKHQLSFLVTEDLFIGKFDRSGDLATVNNAPDISTTLQFTLGF